MRVQSFQESLKKYEKQRNRELVLLGSWQSKQHIVKHNKTYCVLTSAEDALNPEVIANSKLEQKT